MAKIKWVPKNRVSVSVLGAHRDYSHGLGLPFVSPGPVAPSLAVVGGGPSITGHIDALKAWDGEIWAINGAFAWCRENGIEATFYAIDPLPEVRFMLDGVERAVLGDTVCPDVFDSLKGVHVELAPLDELPHGTTAAVTAVSIAAQRGHQHLTFFGCESSFDDVTHAYKNERDDGRLRVECGGKRYLTRGPLIIQAEYLSEIARAVPGFISVAGEGFLPALIKHGDYDVVEVSRSIRDRLGVKE